MDSILIMKVLLSLFVVWLSIVLGERVNLRYAGLITSFPTVVALVILFIGLEQGAGSAGIAAFKISHAIVLFNIWMLWYLLCISFHPWIAGLVSLVLFFASAFGFYELFERVSIVPWAYLLYMVVLLLGFVIFRNTKDVLVRTYSKSSTILIWIKYLFTPLLVIVFTWLSKVTSPVWAGIFISAPSTGLVTLMYFHYKYGIDAARKTLESFYLYTGTFVVFGLAIYFLLFQYSFVVSFVGGMFAACLYAYFVNLQLIPRVKLYLGRFCDKFTQV